MKYLDKIANIAVIVAVVVFLSLVATGRFGFRKAPATASPVEVGAKLNVPGVQFPKDRNTLLLVVSTQCHFCKDNLPFYKDLASKLHGRLNVIAVLPQEREDAQKYLAEAGIGPDQVVTAEPASIGVPGTPTILLVDGSGKVQHEWVGRLDPTGEAEVVAVALPNAPA